VDDYARINSLKDVVQGEKKKNSIFDTEIGGSKFPVAVIDLENTNLAKTRKGLTHLRSGRIVRDPVYAKHLITDDNDKCALKTGDEELKKLLANGGRTVFGIDDGVQGGCLCGCFFQKDKKSGDLVSTHTVKKCITAKCRQKVNLDLVNEVYSLLRPSPSLSPSLLIPSPPFLALSLFKRLTLLILVKLSTCSRLPILKSTRSSLRNTGQWRMSCARKSTSERIFTRSCCAN
jgi:hypothetical protein